MILVVGSPSYASVVERLDDLRCAHTLDDLNDIKDEVGISIDDISMVMFTGGEDVCPEFYNGSDPDGISFTNRNRDVNEMALFTEFVRRGIKLTGICRGFQFLNVMCGGEMYQHIFSHAGMRHDVYYPALDISNEAMSTHHQLVKLPKDAIPVAWSVPNRSHAYFGPKGVLTEPPEREIESAIFPAFNAFGVQYHPEMMEEREPGRIMYEEIIAEFYNMDIADFIQKYGGSKDERRGNQASTAG